MEDLLENNRMQILRYLVQNNGCSRAEIAKFVGLKQATVTKIIRPLINIGVVLETGFTEGLKGRRSIGLSLDYAKYRIIGIKLSWQGLRACVFNLRGDQHGSIINYSFDYLKLDIINNVIKKMTDIIKKLQEKYDNIIAVGVSVPGPFHRDNGTLLLHMDKDSQNQVFPIKDALCKKVSLPVFFEHDATAGALAYWRFKTNYNAKQTLLHLLVSEGVGGGVVSNGQIFSGHHGISAELGHVIIDYNGKKCVCGSRGCLDAYCRSFALENRARELLPQFPDSSLAGVKKITIKTIFEALAAGDALAVKILYEAGEYLGYGIKSLMSVFDPSVVIISDIITQGGQTLMNGINHVLDAFKSNFYKKPEIILLDPSCDLVLLGAAAVSIDTILAEPTKYLVNHLSN